MIDICFSIGSNVGDRADNLESAIRFMRADIGELRLRSSFYETDSWGFESTAFLNAVLLFSTELSPRSCFKAAQEIEIEMGRVRSKEGYADRVIDLDILSYGQRNILTDDLCIPHPRIAERRFVLLPWVEIYPNLVLPGLALTIEEMLRDCKDNGRCEQWEYV